MSVDAREGKAEVGVSQFDNTFTAAVDVAWSREPVGLRELVDRCKPVPEPVLIGPPEKVAEVERLLAEKGIHGVRTVVSKYLDRVYTVPASLIDPPRLVKVDLMTPAEFDEFTPTWRGIPFPKPQPLSVMRVELGSVDVPSASSAIGIKLACLQIWSRYDATHRNPWRKCRRELAKILDPAWRHPRSKRA